jgi:hypothetical protein
LVSGDGGLDFLKGGGLRAARYRTSAGCVEREEARFPVGGDSGRYPGQDAVAEIFQDYRRAGGEGVAAGNHHHERVGEHGRTNSEIWFSHR